MSCLYTSCGANPLCLNLQNIHCFTLKDTVVKFASYVLLFVTACLFSACGSEPPMDSGEITPDVQSEMEKEKQEVFDSESAHRAAQAKN